MNLSDLLSVSRHRVYDLELAIDLSIDEHFEPQGTTRDRDVTIPKLLDAVDLGLVHLDLWFRTFYMSHIVAARVLLLFFGYEFHQNRSSLLD